MSKIFGIGLERTGTTSLCAAMTRLGFNAVHFPRSLDQVVGAEFSNDITVSFCYKFLDHQFPGSKFILTVRNEAEWLDSCRRWYSRLAEQGGVEYDGWHALWNLYGQTEFSSPVWTEGRQRHHADVADYFIDRPDDLLIIQICAGDGWEKLLPFVLPLMPFPLENRFATTEPVPTVEPSYGSDRSNG